MVAMIRQLGESDVSAYVQHCARQRQQSGRDGDPIFMPRSATEPFDIEERTQRTHAAWSRSLSEQRWGRAWGCSVDGVLRGHVDLQGGSLPSESHRAELGLGLERLARRQGHGRTLMLTAIGWARAESLGWIDLYVFAHNTGARALYASVGFVEVGTTPDRFRVDGVSIDDVAMTLALTAS